MLRLDHIVLPIWDVEKSIAFYRDLLGLKLVDAYDGDDWGGYPWLMLIFALGDKREIVLVHFAGAKRPPADKLPKDGRHLAMAETGSLVYFQDPNGVTLEITSPPTMPELTHNERALACVRKWLKDQA